MVFKLISLPCIFSLMRYRNPRVQEYSQKIERQRLPDWFKTRLSKDAPVKHLRSVLGDDALHTVCESAKCPNRGECFSQKTVTFMIMGNRCTRSCGFCAVENGKPFILDGDEPRRVALAAQKLGAEYIVITSVNRDDLKDGGAQHFAETIRAVSSLLPHAEIEVLTSDFMGNLDAVQTVLDARPHVFNHNLETIPDFYSFVRPQAKYERSLKVLQYARSQGSRWVKSGLMLGFGETSVQLIQSFKDLLSAGVNILTLGQYLQPSSMHLAVKEYIVPEQFELYEQIGLKMGFEAVFAGPLVRSSYHAGELKKKISKAEVKEKKHG